MTMYQAEALLPCADGMDLEALRTAAARGDILQSTALAFDNDHQLRFLLGGQPTVMPYAECADGLAEGAVRDIAVLTRVGRPTCFLVRAVRQEPGCPPVLDISRTEAQRACRRNYLDRLLPGDIIPCTVTHIEPFGAFCDVGCGISALLPIDCLSVSRIQSAGPFLPNHVEYEFFLIQAFAAVVYVQHVLSSQLFHQFHQLCRRLHMKVNDCIVNQRCVITGDSPVYHHCTNPGIIGTLDVKGAVSNHNRFFRHRI